MADKSFFAASVLTVANLVIQITLLFTLQPGTYQASELYGGRLTFALLLLVVLIVVAAQFFLWLSMLWFLFAHDRPLRISSFFWLLLMMFTLSVGAAVYYSLRYRKLATRRRRQFIVELGRGSA